MTNNIPLVGKVTVQGAYSRGGHPGINVVFSNPGTVDVKALEPWYQFGIHLAHNEALKGTRLTADSNGVVITPPKGKIFGPEHVESILNQMVAQGLVGDTMCALALEGVNTRQGIAGGVTM